MRYINNRNKEPHELIKYRKGTPGASYDGLERNTKEIIRKSLLAEQGYICAYCMGRIDIDTCTIEHYISQTRHEDSPYPEKEHKKQSLLYSNMSGVCINDSEHCDKRRGNIPLQILNPHEPSCEELIKYCLDGSIVPAGREKEKVKKDIQTLGLDCEKLVKFRIEVWDGVWKRFKQKHKKEEWTKKLLLKYSEKYRNIQQTKKGLRFYQYCNFIAWYFEYFANRCKS